MFLLAMTVLALPIATIAQSSPKPQSPAGDAPPAVVHVLGLDDIKQNTKGKLTITADGLDFRGAASHALVRTASIDDIFTGEDTRQTGGTGLTVAKIAVPYGGGRVLSLFTKEKFDSLTVEYRDENGGLHGVLFRLPLGQAHDIKKQLVAQGAKASIPVEDTATTKDAMPKENK
jgi:hypothetical protein